jgi:ribosome biogenesis GTPase
LQNAEPLDLTALGWDAGRQDELTTYAEKGLSPARVTAQHRGGYVLVAERGEVFGDVAGRLRHEIGWKTAMLPAVGDWVLVRVSEDGTRSVIEAVLERRSKFSRKAATGPSNATEEQVVAANVDTVFLVAGLGFDFNVRRLERYLTTAWESGAQPVIVLTKADLYPEDIDLAVAETEGVAFGVPVHAVSGVTGEGVQALKRYLRPGTTVALLGSSGVGKSTLVNHLAGRQVLETQDVRSDGRGRHTTSHRELVVLPEGALLLDTPGMRELQLWTNESLETSFADIVELAGECRFSDCSHNSEPGCAIKAALAGGTLEQERWRSYQKLQRELRALEIRQDGRLRMEERKARARFARSRRKVKY